MPCVTKAFVIAKKTLKEVFRVRRTLTLGLVLPVVFMLIFGLAFGSESDTTMQELVVLDRDTGTSLEAGGHHGARFVGILENLTYEKSDVRLLRVTRAASEADGLERVRSRDAAAFMVIPANFSDAIAAAQTRGPPPSSGGSGLPPLPGQPSAPPAASARPQATVVMHADPSYSASSFANAVVESALKAYVQKATGATEPVRIDGDPVVSSELTTFDYIAPGLMIFSIINLAPQAAAALARETENRTLDRLRLTRMSAFDLLLGAGLAMLVVSAISVGLMFATARLMGFHDQGGLLPGVAVALVAATSVIGVGMIIAAFAKTQQDAANLGILVSVPASFLSGAFFPIPSVDVLRLGDRVIEIYDVLPTTHAIKALRRVLTYGESLSSVTFELAALTLLSVAFLAVGAVLYTRRRLVPE